MDTDTRVGWHVPTDYLGDEILDFPIESSHPHYRAVRNAMSAMNGYQEQDDAICAMACRGDADSLESWAADDVWDIIAVDTGNGGDPGTYAEDVRTALNALAAEIRRCGCEGKGHEEE